MEDMQMKLLYINPEFDREDFTESERDEFPRLTKKSIAFKGAQCKTVQLRPFKIAVTF